MGSVLLLLTGGFGALLSLFLSPFSAAEDAGLEWTAVVGACGFIAGVHLLVLWYFVKVRLVRLLLQYNGWFLRPKRPINMVRVSACLLQYAIRPDLTSLAYNICRQYRSRSIVACSTRGLATVHCTGTIFK